MNSKNNILDSEKTLHVLKEIERDPRVTQRDLARRLEVSLGKINYLLNALIKKGLIEIKNFKNSKNRLVYTYLLTSKGLRTKLELTHKFLIWKIWKYERLEKEIESYKKEVFLSPGEILKESQGT